MASAPGGNFDYLKTYASVAKLRKNDLKKICGNLSCAFQGLGKNALVNIVCTQLGISTDDSKRVKAKTSNQSTTESKTETISLNYLQKLSNWKKSLIGFPDNLDIQVVKSFLLGKGFSGNALKKYKTLRAWQHKDGVHSLRFQVLPLKDRRCAVRACCNPSFSTDNEETKLIYIVFDMDSAVPVFTHCTCTVGLRGDCSHVGAVLFVLCDIIAEGLQELPPDPTCTEVKCKWSDPKGANCDPKMVEEIHVYKSTFGKEPPTKKRKVSASFADRVYKVDETEEDSIRRKQELKQNIFRCNKRDALPPIFHLINFSPKKQQSLDSFQCSGYDARDNEFDLIEIEVEDSAPETSTTPPAHALQHDDMISPIKSHPASLHDIRERADKIKRKLDVSDAEMKSIEEETKEQSKSVAWFRYRKPRITASQLKRALIKPTTSPTKAIEDILGYKSTPKSLYMEDGLASEPEIILRYSEDKDVTVAKCGFFICKNFPFLGASPDGLVGEDGLIEVKKIHPRENETLQEALLRQHICKLDEDTNQMVLNKSHRYFFQVQQQLLCTERAWGDFVASDGNSLFISRVSYDEQFWNERLPQLQKFYDDFLLLELAYPRVKYGLDRIGKFGIHYDSLPRNE